MNKIDFTFHPELEQNSRNQMPTQQNQQNQQQNPEMAYLSQIASRYPDFRIADAYNAGYSAQEIAEYLDGQSKANSNNLSNQSQNFDLGNLAEKHPNFDFQGALQAGYSPEEIQGFLKDSKPKKNKKSLGEKALRIGEQYALGVAENALLPYELAVAPLASKEAQNVLYRETLSEDLERLMDQKAMGQWDDQDQALYDSIVEQIKDPRKSMENVHTTDVGIRGLAEKATGQDLHPEGILEKAANWKGFIKDPKKLAQLTKIGLNPKEISKNLLPGFKSTARGLSAGTALQLAEEGKFGPIGTIVSAIIGDVIGHGAKGIFEVVKNPKKAVFSLVGKLDNTKKAIRSDLKDAVKETEFTKDLGLITDNNIVQMIQARLTASGLFGKPLQDLRKKITNEVVNEYETVMKELGSSSTKSSYELGKVMQNTLEDIRDVDLNTARKFYSQSENSLKEGAKVNSKGIEFVLKQLENKLSPGSIKSTEQSAVLGILEKLKKDIYETVEAKPKPLLYSASEEVLSDISPKNTNRLKDADVRSLINNKVALNDIINYEVQGGQKKLLIELRKEIDRAVISHGRENPTFAKNYINANKKFSEHAKTFRNKNIDQMLRLQDPSKLLNKMDSVQGIRDVKKILDQTPQGRQAFREAARSKMDDLIGKNIKNGMTEQLKSGKFFNALENKKNKEIIKELISPDAYKKLINLQKHVGKLAESSNKFFNASQSATAASDLAAMATLMTGLFGLFTGNPFMLIGSISTGVLMNETAKLISDPKFLKLVENAVKSSEKNNINLMNLAAEEMMLYLKEVSPALANELITNQTDKSNTEMNMQEPSTL